MDPRDWDLQNTWKRSNLTLDFLFFNAVLTPVINLVLISLITPFSFCWVSSFSRTIKVPCQWSSLTDFVSSLSPSSFPFSYSTHPSMIRAPDEWSTTKCEEVTSSLGTATHRVFRWNRFRISRNKNYFITKTRGLTKSRIFLFRPY